MKFYWHTTHLSPVAELSGHSRDHEAREARNIYYMAFEEKVCWTWTYGQFRSITTALPEGSRATGLP